jgi:hypothetical protein
MAFSDIEIKRIDNEVGGLCRRRNRPELHDQLRLEYKVKVHDVVLYEVRPHWDGRPGTMETNVAKFKFVRTKGLWRLFWRRQDLKWHSYEPNSSSRDLQVLVNEVDGDRYGCFFG